MNVMVPQLVTILSPHVLTQRVAIRAHVILDTRATASHARVSEIKKHEYFIYSKY